MQISDDQINQIRSQADIVDIIGRYIPLVKKGRSMSAVCPFHDDHDPSLSISQDKQIYKCFVCNNGGNVFTFVQNYENIGFVESVVKVAELVGFPLDIKLDDLGPKRDPRKDSLYKCMNEAIHFLEFQLKTTEGKQASEYCEKRGLSKEICEQFEIGYNGGNNQLYNFLKAKGYQESELLACNLVRLNNQQMSDVFYNRITFPIHDSLGNPIAFSARSMDPDALSKYINSNETELYIKGNVVYNYHRAKESAKKEGRIIVCEGVMDVIAYGRAGIKNVVATLGTACTKEQIRLIRQCSNHVVFCYDPDKAGRAATLKAAKMALDAGCEVSVLDNKTSLDPDEMIQQFGLDELKAFSKKEIVYMEFVFEEYQRQFNLQNYSEKKEFALTVKKEIDSLRDDFDRQSFIHRLTTLTGFKETQLGFDQSHSEIKQNKRSTKIVSSKILDGKTSAEYNILSQMLICNEACEIFKSKLGFLSGEETQRLAMLILDYYRKYKQMNIANFLDFCKNDSQKKLVLDLTSHEMYLKEFNENQLSGSIQRFKRAMLEEKIQDLQIQIQNVNGTDRLTDLLSQKRKLQGELEELKHEE